MNLVIDVGNTRVKTALFEGVKLQGHKVFLKEEIVAELKIVSEKHKIDYAIISSVAFNTKCVGIIRVFGSGS